jgi:mannose-6-phosphate isomerase-like protein (cupin superfamily)
MPKIKFSIDKETINNINYRKVIFTGRNLQLVLMSLKPLEGIGWEIHDHVDQFFRVEEGEALVVINKKNYFLESGDAIIVPAGNYHDVINRSGENFLKLYTIYAPPNHPPGRLQKKKPRND